VKVVGACRLVDVLAEWGSHNTEWRVGRVVNDTADAVEVALTYYSALVGAILAAGPVACLRVKLDAADLPLVVAVNGRDPLAKWAAARAQDTGHAGRDGRVGLRVRRNGDHQRPRPAAAARGLRRLPPWRGMGPEGRGGPHRREPRRDRAAAVARS
jgi:hypothetical protein